MFSPVHPSKDMQIRFIGVPNLPVVYLRVSCDGQSPSRPGRTPTHSQSLLGLAPAKLAFVSLRVTLCSHEQGGRKRFNLMTRG